MNTKFTKLALGVLLASTTLFSCDSDDDSNQGSNCEAPTLVDQVAKGNFRGDDFTVQGGSFRAQTFSGKEEYFCRINIKTQVGGSCDFPQFEGTNDALIFSVPSLELQTISFTQDFDADQPEFNFNRITNEETQVELSCGTLIITEYDFENNQLKGSVTANGIEGSIINGNFVLDLCK